MGRNRRTLVMLAMPLMAFCHGCGPPRPAADSPDARQLIDQMVKLEEIGAIDPTPEEVAKAQQVARVGRPAVPPLLKVMKHPSQRVRSRAALALGLIGDPRAVDALAREAVDPKGQSEYCESRLQAVIALGRIADPRAVPALKQAFTDDNRRFVRRAAARALARIGGSGLDVLKGSGNRREAAEGLAEMGERAIPLLAPLLKDEDDTVQRDAACSLCEIGTPQAVSAVLARPSAEWLVWFSAPLRAPEPLHTTVARALGRAGCAVTTAGLANAARDRNPDIRHLAAWALAQTDPESRALRTFEDPGKYWDHLRGESAVPIDPAAIPPLRALLADRDERVRRQAAFGLARSGDPAAIPVLKAAAGGGDKELAQAAADALEGIENARRPAASQPACQP